MIGGWNYLHSLGEFLALGVRIKKVVRVEQERC